MAATLAIPTIVIISPTGVSCPFIPSFAGPVRAPRTRVPLRRATSAPTARPATRPAPASLKRGASLSASRPAPAPPSPATSTCTTTTKMTVPVHVRIEATDDVLELRVAPSSSLESLRDQLYQHVSPTLGMRRLWCSSGELELEDSGAYEAAALGTHWTAFLRRAERDGDVLRLVLH